MESQTFLPVTVVLLVLSHTLPTLVTATRTSTWNKHSSHIDSTHHGVRLSHTSNTIFPVTGSPLRTETDWSSPSTLLPTTPRCQDNEHTLTDTNGSIHMVSYTEICLKQTWDITLPSPEDGLVIQLYNLTFSLHCMLTFQRLPISSNTNPLHTIRYGYSVPILLRTNSVRVLLEKEWICLGCYCHKGSMIYTAHPIRMMPKETEKPGSLYFYICSENLTLPSALQCNMVQECVGNEDEHGCDYIDIGCGDWLPLRNHCLKLDFVQWSRQFTPQTMPAAAEEACIKRYGARLAQLRDLDDVNFIGRIIKQAGFSRASIALRKTKPVSKRLSHLYRFTTQWGDRGSPIFYELKVRHTNFGECVGIEIGKPLCTIDCSGEKGRMTSNGYICMKPSSVRTKVRVREPLSVHFEITTKNITQFPTRQCPDGSLMQLFHRCYHETIQEAMARSSLSVVLFACRYGPPVHYTLVCDGNADCVDANDEADCGPVKFPPLLDSMFRCRQFQLIHKLQRCDGKYDCFDGSDETSCMSCNDLRRQEVCYERPYETQIDNCQKAEIRHRCKFDCHNCSHVVITDGFGGAYLQPTNDSKMEGMFRCRDGDYYIPSFLLNNGELDCKYGEDENIPLTNFTCPGFYRCRDSFSCVHPDHVCDGIHHCPYKDDERYCDLVCPEGCLCEGYAFSCRQFSVHPGMLLGRYLDLTGSQNLILPETIQYLEVLQYLNLSRCNLDTVILRNASHLRQLDLSLNNIKTLSSIVFKNLFQMRYLDASHNPFAHVLDDSFFTFIKQSPLSNLQRLLLRNTNLHSITDRALSQLTNLKVLDIRDNPIDSYDREVFWGLDSLQQLYTDDPNLCCRYFHSSDTVDCVAPFDELSSCSDLLRLNFFRVFLWLMALLAILGNASVWLYRLFGGKQRTFSSFRVLVSNLCVADLIMGVYMTMIGIADSQFQGQYVAKEKAWKRGVMCNIAGFLGFVSCETSALSICLITLDRVLVVCFPLKAHLHLTVRSSMAVCGVVWFVAVTLAAVPLLAGLQFYGVNSICLPLPITRRQFSGQFYSFGVFIVFNFVIFVLIGLGQILIYHEILRASKAVGTDRKSQEMTIARRLFLVIVSDFCCWFPIGLMGILAVSDLPISDEVNVWAAIFILPLNSALNPFLYTLNSFREKWRAEKLKKGTSKFLDDIHIHLPKMLPSSVEELVIACVRSNVVKREKILEMLQIQQDNTRAAIAS